MGHTNGFERNGRRAVSWCVRFVSDEKWKLSRLKTFLCLLFAVEIVDVFFSPFCLNGPARRLRVFSLWKSGSRVGGNGSNGGQVDGWIFTAIDCDGSTRKNWRVWLETGRVLEEEAEIVHRRSMGAHQKVKVAAAAGQIGPGKIPNYFPAPPLPSEAKRKSSKENESPIVNHFSWK